MSQRKFKSVRGAKLTPPQQARVRAGQAWVKTNKPRLTREALTAKAQMEAAFDAMQLLKAERERCGISLGQLAKRCGIDKSRLSKLENDINANPTFATLQRIAEAIGVKLTIGIRRQDAA
ncbi:MAG: helix-turn-helix transcriptional regulator [Phycisphaeraceae bacterium]|nr:helix-turn-helix transcriptional regulator [Phycisphaeraceae bacterium]